MKVRNKKSSEELLLLEREFRAEANRQMAEEGDALPDLSMEAYTLPVDSKVPSDMLNGVYIMRLVQEGVPLERAFDLIIDGILRPN